MKRLSAKQFKGHTTNEQELFRGIKGEAIDEILNDGFDDRFWGKNYSRGNWGMKETFSLKSFFIKKNSTIDVGHGAYLADDLSVSHGYTETDESQRRSMYYNKVTLGREYMMQGIDKEFMTTPKLFHSVHGQYPDYPY